jgi:hypothetical protein
LLKVILVVALLLVAMPAGATSVKLIVTCNWMSSVVKVDVWMTDYDGLFDAFGLDVTYNDRKLTYDSCVAGEFTDTWFWFGCFEHAEYIRMGGHDVPGEELDETEQYLLGTIIFEINESASGTLSFRPQNFTDDLDPTSPAISDSCTL